MFIIMLDHHFKNVSLIRKGSPPLVHIVFLKCPKPELVIYAHYW